MPGPRIIGRYALYDEIASGGMATVHLGRLIGSGGVHRVVAIKCLHPQFAKDPEFVKMFMDEARVASRIHHPNVVPLLDFLALEGELFIVMDYVPGEALLKLVSANKGAGEHVPRKIVASIMTGVLHGLHAAHVAKSPQGVPLGIVHRDVSPQNVIVGVDGIARVLDFGVAQAVGRLQTTQEGQIKGKISYMAPEQLRSEPVDHRADIYSAGVVLWELLTGRRLFPGTNAGAVLTDILMAKRRPPSALAPDLPKAWDEITMKAVDTDPERRFPTADAMAAAIESLVGGASPRVVREWVLASVGSALQAREAVVQRVERDMGPDPLVSSDALVLAEPSVASSRSSSTGGASTLGLPDTTDVLTPLPSGMTGAPGPSNRAAHVAIALAVVAVLGGAALVVRSRQPAPSVASEPAPVAPSGASPAPTTSGSSAAVVPVVVAGEPADSAAAAASSAADPQEAPAKPAPAKARARPPPAKPPARGNCASPFYVDQSGVKRVKRECL